MTNHALRRVLGMDCVLSVVLAPVSMGNRTWMVHSFAVNDSYN
jgi:hypothetical protein